MPAGSAGGTPEGVWPLDPRPAVVGAFAPPPSPWAAGHRGVDLSGRVGQPVRAALAGTVRFAGTLAGRGVLVVGHGATRTTYEPVAALVVVGARVARGEVVGVLEGGGSHCAPAACLHWGWRRGERYLDPLLLVGGGPVRLLPLDGGGGGPAAAVGPTAAAGAWAGGDTTGPAARSVTALWRPLAELGLLPCPAQARGWACR
nr:M23 family metallopeptidase [Nocardioides perillae]